VLNSIKQLRHIPLNDLAFCLSYASFGSSVVAGYLFFSSNKLGRISLKSALNTCLKWPSFLLSKETLPYFYTGHYVTILNIGTPDRKKPQMFVKKQVFS